MVGFRGSASEVCMKRVDAQDLEQEIHLTLALTEPWWEEDRDRCRGSGVK